MIYSKRLQLKIILITNVNNIRCRNEAINLSSQAKRKLLFRHYPVIRFKNQPKKSVTVVIVNP